MNVAWGLCWGGSRSTKNCIFPCKVASAGDEMYLVCAAVAAAVGLPFFGRTVTVALLWVCLCVRSYRVFFESVVADRSGMATWLLSRFVAMCVDTCGLAT